MSDRRGQEGMNHEGTKDTKEMQKGEIRECWLLGNWFSLI